MDMATLMNAKKRDRAPLTYRIVLGIILLSALVGATALSGYLLLNTYPDLPVLGIILVWVGSVLMGACFASITALTIALFNANWTPY